MVVRYLLAIALVACTPLPAEPAMGGPSDRPMPAGPSVTRELTWVSAGRTVRITLGSRVCRDGPRESASCVRLSATDRKELDRFFGAETFRHRWSAYGACGTRFTRIGETTTFSITYADGETIAKPLDAPNGTPLTHRCDLATHDAVTTIEDDLVKRYFP
jgi:hypothetical protein